MKSQLGRRKKKPFHGGLVLRHKTIVVGRERKMSTAANNATTERVVERDDRAERVDNNDDEFTNRASGAAAEVKNEKHVPAKNEKHLLELLATIVETCYNLVYMPIEYLTKIAEYDWHGWIYSFLYCKSQRQVTWDEIVEKLCPGCDNENKSTAKKLNAKKVVENITFTALRTILKSLCAFVAITEFWSQLPDDKIIETERALSLQADDNKLRQFAITLKLVQDHGLIPLNNNKACLIDGISLMEVPATLYKSGGPNRQGKDRTYRESVFADFTKKPPFTRRKRSNKERDGDNVCSKRPKRAHSAIVSPTKKNVVAGRLINYDDDDILEESLEYVRLVFGEIPTNSVAFSSPDALAHSMQHGTEDDLRDSQFQEKDVLELLDLLELEDFCPFAGLLLRE